LWIIEVRIPNVGKYGEAEYHDCLLDTGDYKTCEWNNEQALRPHCGYARNRMEWVWLVKTFDEFSGMGLILTGER
jgi:hypothetical protein